VKGIVMATGVKKKEENLGWRNGDCGCESRRRKNGGWEKAMQVLKRGNSPGAGKEDLSEEKRIGAGHPKGERTKKTPTGDT